MFKRLFSAALIFGAAAIAPPAEAQTLTCMPREMLVNVLETQFSETAVGRGLQSEELMLEVYSSDVSGSFTIFITNAHGISCIVSAGQNWQDAEPMVTGLDS